MRDQDSGFLEGAFVLALAGFTVKIIGAFNRIPLYGILGSEGMGLYQMAYPVYTMLLTISSTGLNVAISKVVAERWALGMKKQAVQAFKVSMALMAVFGLASSLALYGSSGWIAANMGKDPRASLSIAALSPALLFVPMLAAWRGWFQGIQRMNAPALSQVIEQVGRLLTMLLLGRALLPRGIQYASAGATFGAVVGAILAVIYIGATYLRDLRPWRFGRERLEPSERFVDTARQVVSIAVPVSLASAVFSITEFVDLGIVPSRLHAAGFTAQQATSFYGQLTAAVFPLLNIPTIFTGALQMALVPSIAASAVSNDQEAIKRRVRKALVLTLTLGLSSAIGLYVLADPIPQLLFGESDIGPLLRAAAPGVLFFSLQQVTAGILQGIGKLKAPINSLLWAVLAKALVTYVLVGNPEIGIVGAAIATSVYFLVAGFLNLAAVQKELGRIVDGSALCKLAVAGAAMGLAAGATYAKTAAIAPWRLAVAVAIGVGAALFGFLVVALGVVTRDEFRAFPGLGRLMGRLPRRRK